jgi:hypothetical protein
MTGKPVKVRDQILSDLRAVPPSAHAAPPFSLSYFIFKEPAFQKNDLSSVLDWSASWKRGLFVPFSANPFL